MRSSWKSAREGDAGAARGDRGAVVHPARYGRGGTNGAAVPGSASFVTLSGARGVAARSPAPGQPRPARPRGVPGPAHRLRAQCAPAPRPRGRAGGRRCTA